MSLRLGRYFWKLFLANAAVMVLVLAVCVWVIVAQLDRLREEELSRHLFTQASSLEVAVRDRFDGEHADELNSIAKQVGSTELEGVRVTFVLADGVVLGDSEADATHMESHADRPEIRQAMSEGTGESVRWSHTVAKNLKYVAVRVGSVDEPRGVVRVSMAVQSIADRAEPMRRMVVVIALVSVLAAVILAMALALLWSRRIQRITDAARSISAGDFSARVAVVGHDEVAELGRSLNEMRQRFSTHVDTIDRQRRTLDSLVSQLREGVVLVDGDDRIVLINSEAVAMLHPAAGRPEATYVGQSLEQCVPHHKLQGLLQRSDDAREKRVHDPAREIELALPADTGHRRVLARAFDVRLPAADQRSGSHGSLAGRALLLTDITELSRVMQIKADLAANASHELRTPLSAIRAAVETLRSMGRRGDPDATSLFIDVVDRHSGRMEAMIGDLLELSRLESGTGRFDVVSVSAESVLEETRKTFADALAAKNLRCQTSAPSEDVTLTINAELLGIILSNLIDNAIRFTDSGGEIRLSVRRDGGFAVFEVMDTGCGIAPENQHRVFERFYQVERARSGPERGTGLGLSIVRHAVAAMNAHIELQSTLGEGTQITVRFPLGPSG